MELTLACRLPAWRCVDEIDVGKPLTGARRGRATATLAFDHIGSFADTTEDGNLYISIGVKAATRDAAGGVGAVLT